MVLAVRAARDHLSSNEELREGSLPMSADRDQPEPSSPACLAHEADDAYMGYATKDELAAFLNELLEAERAGTGVALKSGQAAARSSSTCCATCITTRRVGARCC